MAAVVCLQVLIMLMAAAMFWVFRGEVAALSALMGGFVYVLPTLFAIILLKVISKRHLAAEAFLPIQAFKIILVLLFMLLVFVFYHEQLDFIPFIIVLILVSQLVFLVSWKVQKLWQMK